MLQSKCNEKGNEKGFSLLELIIVIALASLVATLAMGFFKDANRFAQITREHRDSGFQAQNIFSSLSENLLAGGGVLFLSEDRLIVLNRSQVKVEYHWEDSTLSINGKILPLRFAEFKIEPEGPDRPNQGKGYPVPDSDWDLDSLDDNRDDRIDFQELDLDRSRDLDAYECRFVARYRISMVTLNHNLPMPLIGLIHPRNHLTALSKKEWASSASGDDFTAF